MSLRSWLRRVFVVESRNRPDDEPERQLLPHGISSAQTQVRPGPRVPKVFRFIRAKALLRLQRLEPLAQWQSPDPTTFFSVDQPPPLVLFISHRWDSCAHPDPSGRQLAAIQKLLGAIVDIASASVLSRSERLRLCPSILVHGLLQAALIVAAKDSSDKEDNVWRSWEPILRQIPNVDLLDHIGIWYDFACMPLESLEPASYRESLQRLPDLVRACPILILRSENDHYEERGWCVAEVAAARHDRNILVLRTDLLGTPIPASSLTPGDAGFAHLGDRPDPFFQLLEIALNDWESAEQETGRLRNLFVGLPAIKEAEEARQVPILTTGRNPHAFPQQRAILLYFMDALRELSHLDARHGFLPQPFDLAAAVRNAMSQVQLTCTEPRDVVFVGLSILYSRHHPRLVPTVERFYRDAIERWLRRESLCLVRFREQRPDPLSWEVWYVFEGEDEKARGRPKWTR